MEDCLWIDIVIDSDTFPLLHVLNMLSKLQFSNPDSVKGRNVDIFSLDAKNNVDTDANGTTSGKSFKFDLCCICQSDEKDVLVETPSSSSYDKVLNGIKELGQYRYMNYAEINARMQSVTRDQMEKNKASWHRSCYQNTCNKTTLARAKHRFEKDLNLRVPTATQVLSESSHSNNVFLRSQSRPLMIDECLFCDESDNNNKLYSVVTDAAGKNLKEAVLLSNNDKWKVKLSTAINPEDAHAVDVKYHKPCWNKYVYRINPTSADTTSEMQCAIDDLAAEAEFIGAASMSLKGGSINSLSELEKMNNQIRKSNNLQPSSRWKVKQLLLGNISDIEFHKPKQKNASLNVSIKATRDNAISHMDTAPTDMNNIFQAAALLRNKIQKSEKWTFSGSLSDITERHVPKELCWFFQ